jgi:antitoxin component YwqK of YwqJK toxin-antitoxin module
MKYLFFSIFLFFVSSLFAQETSKSYDPLDSIYYVASKTHDGRYELVDEKSNLQIQYQYENQRINGKYSSSYVDGNKRVKGHYKNGKRSGKWKYYNDDNKKILVRKYEENNYTTRFIRLENNKKVVQNGKGEFTSSIDYFGYSKPQQEGSKKNICFQKYKKGLKQGVWTESQENKQITYKASFLDGKYHGNVMHYDSVGNNMETKFFDHAIPTSIWEVHHEGEVYRSDYREPKLTEKAIPLYFPTEREIISSFETYTIYFAEDLNKFLFTYKEDSVIDFFQLLEIMYQASTISAYQDYSLKKAFFPTHNAPSLNGFNINEDVKFRSYALVLNESYVFEKQYSMLVNQILSFNVILQYQTLGSDTIKYKFSPWFYYPEMQKILALLTLGEEETIDELLYYQKQPSYLYLKNSNRYNKQAFTNPVFLIQSAVKNNKENRLLMIENEHFWWYPFVETE